jgi:hypothetical protein
VVSNPGARLYQAAKNEIKHESKSLCANIGRSISAEKLIPEEMNHAKIAVRVPMMNKVEFLLTPKPRKLLKPRSLYVIFLVEKYVGVKRRRS